MILEAIAGVQPAPLGPWSIFCLFFHHFGAILASFLCYISMSHFRIDFAQILNQYRNLSTWSEQRFLLEKPIVFYFSPSSQEHAQTQIRLSILASFLMPFGILFLYLFD